MKMGEGGRGKGERNTKGEKKTKKKFDVNCYLENSFSQKFRGVFGSNNPPQKAESRIT